MSDRLLLRTQQLAQGFLAGVDARPVFPQRTFAQLIAALDVPLQDDPLDATTVIEELASAADPGLVANQGPRYFGFVTGGSLPAAIAADWLTSAWDQNAGLYVLSPAASAIEQIAAGWVIEVLGLPASSSVGFVTGATLANVTALAAARHEVLRRAGWDVEADGLQDAARITVVAGADAHASIGAATRLIGLGSSTIVRVNADGQGRMLASHLGETIARIEGPLIVCVQAGNVNTGAFDPVDDIATHLEERGAWLHVDGAFGLWAAASRSLRHLARGMSRADSWTVDGHKWLNVPYDSGFAIVRHPAAHRAAMSQAASYLLRAPGDERDGMDWTPEASRRARGIAVYAALRSMGRLGLEDLVDRCCRCARRIADGLRLRPGVEILNDIVLNQVLLRIRDRAGSNVTSEVAANVQADGVCWAGTTGWHGEAALRISVSGWKTGDEDADRSIASIMRAIGAHDQG
jgi:glutamate/tyrosine decarboxylase-like PLP-dependent enzyme